MKKLLAMLTTITNLSSITPIILANASAKIPENKIINNKINYQQTNNLENLNRVKRSENTNHQKTVIVAGASIASSGVVLNNKIYFGSFDNNVYEYDPATNQQKVVITANSAFTSSGVVLNNKIYFGSWDNKVYKYDPATGRQKTVIVTKHQITSSGVVLNNKIYFGSWDNKVYEYDPATGRQKTVIDTDIISIIVDSGVVLNNKIYFGSWDNNVYEYDPATNQQKVVITATRDIISSGVVLNNKIYFGSQDHNVYEYDPATNQQKVVITATRDIISSGVVLNNKIYFGSWNNKVYKYDPATGQNKVVITATNSFASSGVVLNNKIYFGSWDNKVYKYDPATNQQKVVITATSAFASSGVVLNNKIYFGSWDNKVYEYDPATNQQKVVITATRDIISSGVVLNNKIYFGSKDGKVYEYNSFLDIKDVITNNNLGKLNSNDASSIKDAVKKLNPSLDINDVGVSQITDTSADIDGSPHYNSNKYKSYKKVFFKVKQDLNIVITNTNLNVINNSDEAILNELNYLKTDLDISQIEIKDKNNISATIRAKSNSRNYFGEKKINYVINQQKKVNLDELIKKAIFLKFRDENPDLIFKETKDINADNLQYLDIRLEQQIDPIFRKDIYLHDCTGVSSLENKTSSSQTLKTKECREFSEIEKRIRLSTSLGKTKAHEQSTQNSFSSIKSSELSEIFEKSEIKTNSKSRGWNLELNGQVFGIGASAGGHGEKVESDTVSYNRGISKITGETSTTEKSKGQLISLASNINLDNTDEKVISKSIHFVWPSQEISVSPGKKVNVNYIINKINFEITFDLEQDIYGNITFNIYTKNNEIKNFTFSIGKLMQKLKQYNLLPKEIQLYNDSEKIYFNGKLYFSIKKGFQESIRIEEEELDKENSNNEEKLST